MIVAIVPAYNEEGKISKVVKKLSSAVDKVVVIDDGSSDDTFMLAANAGAQVIRHEVNRGQGAAIETGRQYLQNLGVDHLVIFDGDDQFDARDIEPAIDKMKKERADVLFGSRFLDKSSKIPVTKKYLLLPTARLVDSFFSGLHLSDVHNGFRIFNRKAMKEIKITQDRMAHATEIPTQVKDKDLDYIEFPVSVTYDQYGQNFLEGFSILKDLILSKFVS